MRLIDADKIEVENLEGVVMSFAQEVIDDTPTEDAELVVHAHWMRPARDSKKHSTVGICSNCNRQDHIDPLAAYCRYCGAMMDGGVENE